MNNKAHADFIFLKRREGKIMPAKETVLAMLATQRKDITHKKILYLIIRSSARKWLLKLTGKGGVCGNRKGRWLVSSLAWLLFESLQTKTMKNNDKRARMIIFFFNYDLIEKIRFLFLSSPTVSYTVQRETGRIAQKFHTLQSPADSEKKQQQLRQQWKAFPMEVNRQSNLSGLVCSVCGPTHSASTRQQSTAPFIVCSAFYRSAKKRKIKTNNCK